MISLYLGPNRAFSFLWSGEKKTSCEVFLQTSIKVSMHMTLMHSGVSHIKLSGALQGRISAAELREEIKHIGACEEKEEYTEL